MFFPFNYSASLGSHFTLAWYSRVGDHAHVYDCIWTTTDASQNPLAAVSNRRRYCQPNGLGGLVYQKQIWLQQHLPQVNLQLVERGLLRSPPCSSMQRELIIIFWGSSCVIGITSHVRSSVERSSRQSYEKDLCNSGPRIGLLD